MNDKLFDDASRLYEAGNLAEAARLYSDVIRANPKHFEALYRLGAIHFQNGRFADAEYLFAAASKLDANVPEAFYSRGCALQNLQRHEDALVCFARALAIRPGYIEARNNRGISLLTLRRYHEALACFDRVLAQRPNEALVHGNRASALSELKRHDEALVAADRALRLNRNDTNAWQQKGIALVGLSRHEEAIAAFDEALAIKTDCAPALSYRGYALSMLGRHEEGLASYDKGLLLTPNDTGLLNNRCNALLSLGRFKDAIAECEELLRLDPDFKSVRGNMLHAKLQICDWSSLYEDKAKILARLRAGLPVLQPLQHALIFASEADQLQCSRIWTATVWPPSAPAWRGETYRHDKIRVAYVSENLRAHAVAHAIAGVFEHHDKARFETTAIALGAGDGSTTRARLMGAFDRFIDAKDKSNAAVAGLIRKLEIDVAVDLMGFTEGARSGIFAARPAPIQVNYLGFPGTMGAPYMDYIVVDPIVVPAAEQAHYAEKLVYLPDSYMPYDFGRAIAPVPTRAQAGLPQAGFVFCSFNNAAKVNPEMFDVWMRLLSAVEESVLWLSVHAEDARDNLKREAKLRGVAQDRIVFAPFLGEAADHLARLSLADLFLDTLPYNAHAGGADALWAGVPILTCRGSTFAGRVGASLLNAVGLPELIAGSLADYEALALKLARDGERLLQLRAKLARNRANCPLFDTARFTRHLEAAFLAMWERHRQGKPPESFAVEPKAPS